MTYMPESMLAYIANRWTAADHPNLSAATMRTLAEIHRSRGERLSQLQYLEAAEAQELSTDTGCETSRET